VVRLAAVLRAAGFPTWSVPDIKAVTWYKLCLLLPGALVTSLTRRSYAEMALHPELSRLWVQIMREVFAVPLAKGLTIADPPGSLWHLGAWLKAPDEVALEGLRAIGEGQRRAGERMLPSMLQDVLAGRRTEAADLLPELLRQAHDLGVPVPATETCYRLIRGLEDGFGA
jgi:ketopantoate reductase